MTGIDRGPDGQFEFNTPQRSVAPVRLGIYRDGQQEPSLDQNGAGWLRVSGTGADKIIQLKVIVDGAVYPFGVTGYASR